jgi:lipoyl(octanoyl) transferase
MGAVSAELWCVRLGLVPYGRAREAQRRLEAARQGNRVPDLLLLLEHSPVYTRGRRSEPAELPMGEEWYRMQGIEVCETDRGGRVTYHGPPTCGAWRQ